MLTLLLSRSTKEISMMRVNPAAIKVYPKIEWIIVLIIRACECADIAYPVIRMTKAGMRLRFGRPFRLRLSHMPTRPAHHQTIPIVVCCRSL